MKIIVWHEQFSRARMVAQVLLFGPLDNEKTDAAVEACSDNMKARILGEMKRERRNLEALLARCNGLEERLKPTPESAV